jgi:hypothetical protein
LRASDAHERASAEDVDFIRAQALPGEADLEISDLAGAVMCG